MLVNYDIQKINHILEDFHNVTGINMDLLKDDFSYVGDHSYWENRRYCKAIQSTEQGKRACVCSDMELFKKSRESRRAEVHICHAGLVDVSVPILYDDAIIGYIIFGQIKVDTDFEAIKEYLVNLGLDEKEMRKFFLEISTFDEKKIQSISNIANMLAKHILLENMLKPDFDEGVQRTINYINDNLDSELSIQNISKNVNISKSVLYRRFQSCFNCTVNQYINRARIEKAKILLRENNLSVEDIAQKVGFLSGSYFSKKFKKETGMSPYKYKKSQRMK